MNAKLDAERQVKESDGGRRVSVSRVTSETSVSLTLNIDGSGNSEIDTKIGFLDHLFQALAKHARFDVALKCEGDTWIDDHHSAEDCALVFGEGLAKCLSDKRGIERFGHAYAPLDEALSRAVVDLSGRPYAQIDLGLRRESIGQLACENMTHVLQSIAIAGKMTLHVDVLRGENDHHRVESAFKAVAIALRHAVAPSRSGDIPSTKGTLS